MLKIIYLPVRIIRRILKCLMPYDGFRNRKLIRSYAGFQRQFYDKFWNDTTREMGASLIDVGYGYYKIEYNNNKTYVADYKVMLDDHLTLKVAGNKPMVLKILQENDLQAPNFLEYNVDQLEKANVFLEKLGKNAVVKPASGTGSGRGVTTRINSLKKLKKASLLAASYNDNLLIEEQVEGDSFRLLYLDGKFIDAIRRDPPNVIGDGVSSIKVLIKNENLKRTGSNEILTFHPLIIDMECKLKLKEQGLSINSIPEKNKMIIIKSVVNQNSCYENHIVRDELHPDIIAMGRDIVNELGIVLGGIDVITRDITVPLNESNGIINEINTTPGLHHHLLVAEKDKVLPIGMMILQYIFNK
jgi:D-alanine-D-alanine ligase-like ATP-grasp enzyme